jgi:molybdopterin/thiamine biosynthesis adenylyltransferase
MEVFLEKLRAINPDVELVGSPENVAAHNVAGLVAQADVVADGAPLFEERYLMNAAAVRQRKPLVVGAMYGTEGFVSTIVPGETACLACIYRSKPDYWTSIEVFPAIAPAPALVGSMIAMEVIKLVTGFGKPLKGRVWFFDLEHNQTRQFTVKRQPDCSVCGTLSSRAISA